MIFKVLKDVDEHKEGDKINMTDRSIDYLHWYKLHPDYYLDITPKIQIIEFTIRDRDSHFFFSNNIFKSQYYKHVVGSKDTYVGDRGDGVILSEIDIDVRRSIVIVKCVCNNTGITYCKNDLVMTSGRQSRIQHMFVSYDGTTIKVLLHDSYTSLYLYRIEKI